MQGVYRPAWSAEILAELEYEEARKLVARHGLDDAGAAARAARLVATMRSAFDDAEATGWEPLVGTYALPDHDDEHVLAAAVVARVAGLVTSNVKDLPRDKVPFAIEVLPPEEFAANTVAHSPGAAHRAVDVLAARSGRQGRSRTVAEVLDALVHRYGMDEAVGYPR